jgi:ring-1,2-phenylacetyl-CoA epoxidase subunit PaaD
MVIGVEKVKDWLESVKDPEVPVLSLRELGVLRDVIQHNDSSFEIIITPTYSGCPAMNTMEQQIREVLKRKGIENYTITTVLHPPWTTDWMDETAREKLREFGIAPPEGSADKGVLFGKEKSVTCPYCRSQNTKMVSQFGSTACKAMHRCLDCKEPFDYFKCL